MSGDPVLLSLPCIDGTRVVNANAVESLREVSVGPPAGGPAVGVEIKTTSGELLHVMVPPQADRGEHSPVAWLAGMIANTVTARARHLARVRQEATSEVQLEITKKLQDAAAAAAVGRALQVPGNGPIGRS